MNGRKLTAAILFGLGAGAATVYLSNPKHGCQRRADLAKGAKYLFKKVALLARQRG